MQGESDTRIAAITAAAAAGSTPACGSAVPRTVGIEGDVLGEVLEKV